MRSRVHQALVVTTFFGLTLAAACSEEFGVPTIQGLPDGSPVYAVDADVEAEGTDADEPDVPCLPVSPDDTTSVFITTTGTDDANCGTRDAPCKTVATGITRAVALSKKNVQIARGIYVEKVTLKPNIRLEGGWEIAGTTWTRACVAPEESVVLRAPSGENITIDAHDLGGQASVANLRVESKAAGGPGESLYGVFATGASTTVFLTNVHIEVANAGGGPDGATGATGPNGVGTCGSGNGATGGNGSIGNGAVAGSFGALGYVAQSGTSGLAGGAGNNGAAGTAGGCVQCVVCDAFPLCTASNGAMNCGTPGGSGCAGGGGGGGGGAAGGGSSIGVFVWDATVSTAGGRIRSGNGGSGGSGGNGGNGGGGAAGTAGSASAACTVTCAIDALMCAETTDTGAAGGSGGNGGAAGRGGNGGGGAGGWSVATYQGGTGKIAATNTTLAHGTAGAGGGPGASPGVAGQVADHMP